MKTCHSTDIFTENHTNNSIISSGTLNIFPPNQKHTKKLILTTSNQYLSRNTSYGSYTRNIKKCLQIRNEIQLHLRKIIRITKGPQLG